MADAFGHVSVMLDEVLEALAPRDGEIYVDGTFGAGGYTRAILAAADCKVVAIDRDAGAYARAVEMAGAYDGRLMPVRGTFDDVRAHLDGLGLGQVDGFVLDIGVSSMQIDDGGRGFSFMKDGPLDMRMDVESGQSAAEVIADLDERELADIFYRYGQERHARRVAKAIVLARAESPIETTLQLAAIVEGAMPGSARKFAIHPATRVFQALRIFVNGELEQLEGALGASVDVLGAGGRLVVVSFHSLEDSIVKGFFKAQGRAQAPSRYVPSGQDVHPNFEQKNKKAILPSDGECAANVRARSAKLRVGVRTQQGKAA